MAELSNCKHCGKIFVRTTIDVCPTCRKEQDEKYESVYTYIRKQEHREATVNEVHEATGVEEKLIYDWIKEGRLKTTEFSNLGYPCKSCGKRIQSGSLCLSCGARLQNDLKTNNEQQEKNNRGSTTYFTKSK
ncbi:flagellar operon protein (TIGR03826 family) [Scopulibacillus darangshiensis]|uniref:Flagellar operon protein (TIGR03826 family) n=1 Tax=Scopulibacillus darangshiensis TaxID=442528 RepID=A0A4V2SM64_9BACL|nr:TIGR03826 family flagellar region protein [Scopulibacillus darangshiensis]TCP26026.1 flagellar operon protein (TIGR03826 family) [Scopulibacillus darangshiensis]